MATQKFGQRMILIVGVEWSDYYKIRVREVPSSRVLLDLLPEK
jgi:hypothetical protein